MEQVNPTRMELIKKNAQIKLAEQGRDLLREKMDALIQEFFNIMESVSKSRVDLESVAASAQRSLLSALAADDSVTLKSASFATRRGLFVDIKGKNIMGVPVTRDREKKGLKKRSGQGIQYHRSQREN